MHAKPDTSASMRDTPAREAGTAAASATSAAGQGYLFIDNARFFSILAIVMRHTELFEFDDATLSVPETWIIQIRSFGVLIFFVTSGFLMADWLDRPGATRRAYWRTRLDQVVRPWLFWVSCFIFLHLGKLLLRGKLQWSALPALIWQDVFFESYWFVPVLLISIAILLPLRSFWSSDRFGLILLGFTAVYAVNQYQRWFEHSHTVAFFGYLFHLWLGIQLHRQFQAISDWMRRVPWPALLTVFSASLALVVAEGQRLLELGFHDAYSVLNPANQMYSLFVLAVLLKIQVRLVPRFIDVRKESFGIYLTHQTTASVGRSLINVTAGLPRHGRPFFDRIPEMVATPWLRILVWFVWCGIIYTLSLLLTKALRRSRWSILVGIRQPKPAELPLPAQVSY